MQTQPATYTANCTVPGFGTFTERGLTKEGMDALLRDIERAGGTMFAYQQGAAK